MNRFVYFSLEEINEIHNAFFTYEVESSPYYTIYKKLLKELEKEQAKRIK